MKKITQDQYVVGILYIGNRSYSLLNLSPITHFGQPLYLSAGAMVFSVVNSEDQAINVIVNGDFIVEPLAHPVSTSVHYYLDDEVLKEEKTQLTSV